MVPPQTDKTPLFQSLAILIWVINFILFTVLLSILFSTSSDFTPRTELSPQFLTSTPNKSHSIETRTHTQIQTPETTSFQYIYTQAGPNDTTPTPVLPLPSTTPPFTPTTNAITPKSSPIIIGYSVQGLPLAVDVFGSGPTKRMIIAGIHGGYERNTVILADELIAHLRHHSEMIPPELTLYVLRALNPDGFERDHGPKGRGNANGVDLNRNWDAFWAQELPTSGCWNYETLSGGPHPGSEPEVAALMSFITEQRIEALINYHSAALGIFPGGQPPDSVSINLAERLSLISPYAYPPIDTGCQYTGQLIDWASNRGVAAVDIELTNHVDTDFEINLLILQEFLAWKMP
jgi:hypothetical protein